MGRLLQVVLVLACVIGRAWAQGERPQTPEAPFPYRVVDVTIPVVDESSGEQTHTLGGTLTLPDAAAHCEGPYVGVVLLSGSGMQDRDSTIFGHKPFLVIADELTRRGIAVLRFDDRVVGASTGSAEGLTTQDLAHDGLSAARFMMAREEIDAERVGVLGHSEGGMHVPYLAVQDERIAFVISLAGTGVPGDEVLLDQTARMYRAGGNDEAYIREALERRRAIFQGLRNDASDEELVELITRLNMHEFGVTEASEQMRAMSRQLLPQFAGSWARSFILFDSRDYWRRVDVPALVMNGGLDLQVDAELNLGGIREALVEGGNDRYTIIELAGLNHLFQHAKTGLLGEYASIEETFAPEALALIGAWIRSEIVEGRD